MRILLVFLLLFVAVKCICRSCCCYNCYFYNPSHLGAQKTDPEKRGNCRLYNHYQPHRRYLRQKDECVCVWIKQSATSTSYTFNTLLSLCSLPRNFTTQKKKRRGTGWRYKTFVLLSVFNTLWSHIHKYANNTYIHTQICIETFIRNYAKFLLAFFYIDISKER